METNHQSHEIGQNKQAVAGLFGRAASTYDRVGPRFFCHFGRRLVEVARIPKGARVLDIATGTGAVLLPAIDAVGPQGYVTGIDLSEEMVQKASEEIGPARFHELRRLGQSTLAVSWLQKVVTFWSH